ncbi:RING-H2 finger protein ATL13 [Cucumis melo var. makuwa]|uniref:RING-type E3 ubiquitin transferase n=1 Tax=Cucumis melo var. makuwa TaxID=1194695 RepID=A0A5D3BAM4_CUCMM|nr:RING-H2 finger protein ATL13 [Cucumis melo var. makuwa]
MDSLLLQVNGRFFPSPPQFQPYFLAAQPPPLAQSSGFNLENKVSPSVLLIIIILAIVFFVSGLLHLLVRFLWTPPLHRDPESSDNVTAFQGQLQQLFHLHDSGVDQSFIDTLPVFHYKAIIGSKSPFDCAVCLCEFEPEDKLRLLPKCSHAFHTECIDTWLLSHSTCPLCRSSLLPDHFSPHTTCSPIVLVLESGSESSRDIVSDREITNHTNQIPGSNSRMGFVGDGEFEGGSSEITKLEDSNATVVTVKLGKYKNVDAGESGSSENKNVDSRRCFSMGSFEYVMDENSSVKVAIRSTPVKKQASRKPALPLTPGYRAAMSEYDCESRREFKLNGIEPLKTEENGNSNSNNNKIESFSVSKIWLRGKNPKESLTDSSRRRTVSFRLPIQMNSEMNVCRWENESMELDEENQSRNSLESQYNQSLAKRTLQWLMGGKLNKVTHFESTSSPSPSPSPPPSSSVSNI